MKITNFLPKKHEDGYRVRPMRTIVICLLIAVLLISISVGMGYSKYTSVTKPFETTYQVKDYVLPSSNYVIQAFDPDHNTGSYRFVSPDSMVAVNYSKQSTDSDYLASEYLVAFFNPEINTIDYTAPSNQIDLRYEIGLSGVNHTHPLQFFNLKSSINNQPRGIVVYMKVGTDADPDTINANSLTVQYVNPESPIITKSGIASVGQIAISNIGQLYRISTEDDTMNSKFELKYDKKAWAAYADTAWYDSDSADTEFYITTAQELAGLAQIVNAGTDDFSGKTIYLDQNISLADANGYLRRWTPIGTAAHPFKGSFDGQGNTVSGLNVCNFGASGDYAAAGLFGFVSGDASAEIKDLTISTAYVSAELYLDPDSSAHEGSGAAGALVGWAEGFTFSGISIENANICGIAKCGGGMIGRCDAVTVIDPDCTVDADTTTANGGFAQSDELVGFQPTAEP